MPTDCGSLEGRNKRKVLPKEKHEKPPRQKQVRSKVLPEKPGVRGNVPRAGSSRGQNPDVGAGAVPGRIKPYPVWTCRECGEKHGRGMPKDHVFTVHYGKCDVCNKNNFVTEPRDFGHFPEWFK